MAKKMTEAQRTARTANLVRAQAALARIRAQMETKA